MNWFLFPLALIYRLIVDIRNKLFNSGIWKSTAFQNAIISIGNITVGGTGKTPHTEYIINLLKEQYRLATLSRGYKRKTKGFFEVKIGSKISEVGDEPLQIKNKFPDITVAVDEKRVNGVKELLKKENKPQVILLDDAFQHRHIKPGLNILLIDYSRPITKDYLLPMGRLREPSHNCSRANIIIVTKCPKYLQPIDFRIMQKELNLFPYQDLFFTTFKYNKLISVFSQGAGKELSELEGYTAMVVTGIANPKPLYDQLKEVGIKLVKQEFADHHAFTASDIHKITQKFMRISEQKKLIICTEKDATRFKDMLDYQDFVKLPIFYLPIDVEFLNNGEETFTCILSKYIGHYQN